MEKKEILSGVLQFVKTIFRKNWYSFDEYTPISCKYLFLISIDTFWWPKIIFLSSATGMEVKRLVTSSEINYAQIMCSWN